jgi:hypothetical protein
VQKVVAQTEDAAIAGEGDLGVVYLSSFLVRCKKVLPPVFDPLDGPAQLQSGPAGLRST